MSHLMSPFPHAVLLWVLSSTGQTLVVDRSPIEEKVCQDKRPAVSTTYLTNPRWLYFSSPFTTDNTLVCRVLLPSIPNGEKIVVQASFVHHDVAPDGTKTEFIGPRSASSVPFGVSLSSMQRLLNALRKVIG